MDERGGVDRGALIVKRLGCVVEARGMGRRGLSLVTIRGHIT